MSDSRNSKPTRAGLYARVSTSGRGQDVGLQLDDLRQLAEQRGWDITEYIDDGVSGAQASRPALDRLMADARAGRVDVVCIWKLDRLARSLSHLLEVSNSLQSWGVGLVSARDAHINSTSPSGKFALSILGAVAELERELVRERVIAGVRRAQARGKHCGRPRVELDLRPALAMLEAGHGLKTIASSLDISRSTLRRRLQEAGEWPRRE